MVTRKKADKYPTAGYRTILSLCLNFRDARSEERNRNWFPYNSSSACATSETVSLIVVVSVIEKSGTPNTKTVFCFGNTAGPTSVPLSDTDGDGERRTFQFVSSCYHPEAVLRLVDDDAR